MTTATVMTTTTAASAPAGTFTRMDASTREQWMVIGQESALGQARTAEAMLGLLRSLARITDGFAVDQLTHSLQTATRAERAGADDELVVAALFHDVGKAVSVPNHSAISAELLKPYVRAELYHLVRNHQDFQGRHYYAHFGADPDAREAYRGEPWFELTATFADDWDQQAFDPTYGSRTVEYFEPLVRRTFAQARGPLKGPVKK